MISTHARKFIPGISAKRETPHLETAVQSRGESLCDYVARFNMEALKIFHLEDFRAIEEIMKDKYFGQDDASRTSMFTSKHQKKFIDSPSFKEAKESVSTM